MFDLKYLKEKLNRRWSSFEKKKKTFGLVKNTVYKKFIILCYARTGSNLLVSYLNSHPNIKVDGEIFSKLGEISFEKILDSEFRKYPKRIKAVGFKIFYDQPADYLNCGIWEHLGKMDELYVIHLKRQNKLRTMLSLKIAMKNDIWHGSTIGLKDKQVSFSFDELNNQFKQLENWEIEGERRFKEHPLLTIYYEDLDTNPEDIVKKILEFLELPYRKPKTKYSRQNPEKANKLIDNFEELKIGFLGTKWESFFRE